MKKLGAILLVVLMTVALSAVAYAATGEELLKSAEMYLTFEDSYADVNAKHEVQVDGDDPEYVEGRFGKAAAIKSGEGAYYTEDLKFGTNSFTVTMWVNVHEHDSDPCLFANKDWGSGANNGFLLCVRGADWKYNANCDGGTRTDTEYPYDISGLGTMENQWYHIAMVVDREAEWYCLYINGHPLNKGTSFADKGHTGVTYDDEWNEYPFYIGEDGTGFYNMGKLLNFDVDEFAVFFSALSEEDVVAVYTYAPEGYEGAVLEEAADLHQPLPEFTVDPQSVLDSADLYISFDDGISDAKGHAIRQEGEIETVDGISGKAVKIDSDKGHLALDDYKFGTDSFTVTAWINGESSSSDPVVFGNKDWDSSSNPGWLISQRGENWRYAANASGYEKVDKTFSYAMMPEDAFGIYGQWYHMALVVDRAEQTLQLYINGRPYFEKLDFGVDHTDASYDSDFPFVIAEDGPEKYTKNADDCTLIGTYDEIAIFKKALTGEEIAALYSLNAQEEAAAPAAEEPTGPATLLSQSWDNIFVNGEMMVNGGAGAWLAENPIEGDVSELGARGWAYISTPITGFAYAIDGGDAVKSADYIVDRPDVKAAISEEAEGFEITVDVSGLGDGAHTIKFYAVSSNDELVDTTFDLAFTKDAAAAEEPAEEPASKGFADVTAAAAGKNVITGYEFVSGTDSFGGEGPENLWDGETSTKFCTNAFPAESIVKLDGTYDITGFTMATANDNADYNGRSPNAWTISVSADGENWTELAKGDDTFFEETNFTYYAGEGTAQGVSYVKFNAEGTASGTFQVSEVTLFGDKAADVTEELTTKEEAPQTFDFGIAAAVAAVISLAGFAISKKK